MFIIDDIINSIVASGVSQVQDQLNRQENVVRLLKKFNLKPEAPPNEFEGVYVYTLIEYGVGKPEPILKLFRQEKIKSAFSKAFKENNPNLLLDAGEEYLESEEIGAEIRDLDLDYRREFAEFSALFIQILQSLKSPLDVINDHKIANLQDSLNTIRAQLEPLESLPAIQAQIAQLAQSYQGILPPSQTAESVLATQMRGWFDALGYDWENYQVWGEDYFEWIMNIPARRGFDRILVRGIEREAGVNDLEKLRVAVENQDTDEGWLVTNRRISKAARDEVEKRSNRELFCYTFDELLDEAADFSRYVTWLEGEVKKRGVDKMYVPLACTKEEIDPVTKQRVAVSRYEAGDGWIDGYIDLWLDDPAKEHISVLGEFGTGKTWFAFHYAWSILQKYQQAKTRGLQRPRLPLVITLRDYAKALDVENVLAGFFFSQHNLRINSAVFEQLNRMGKLLIIFDGFDEMAAKVDRQQMINNFWELARVVVPHSKVILTCRTEHFPEATEGRALLNAELQASTANLTGETPQFEVLELEKFNDEQIRQVLSFQAQTATVTQVMGNSQLLDLARRPVMIELILEALPEIEAGKPVDISRIYLYATCRKMERDIKSERTFTSLEDKLYFLCELSWEMLATDQMSLNYRLFPDHIRHLFSGKVQEEKDLDHWHYDMMGQTMLIRNASGDYTPAHRSLLEFFAAFKLAGELGILAADFAEVADVSRFGLQADLVSTFGKAPLTKAVLDLLIPMVEMGEGTKARLLEVIRSTRGKSEEEVGYVGGNAATLLLKLDVSALEGCDLSECVILGGDFTKASLIDTNFTDTNLTNSIFSQSFSNIISALFTPNNKMFATGETSGLVRLWQTDEMKQILLLPAHSDWVTEIAFSPDSQILATCSNDQTIKLWDTNTGKCLKTLEGHLSKVFSVKFSPNGKFLASSSNDKTIKIWNIHTGKCLKTLQGHTDRVWSVAFKHDGKIFASGSSDNTIKLWDIKTGKCLRTLHGHTNSVIAVVISDGNILASGSNDRTIKIWDVNTGKCIQTLQSHLSGVISIAIASNGKTLISGSSDTSLKLWNIETGECFNTFSEHTRKVYSVAVKTNEEIIASASDDTTLKFWDMKTGECLKTLQGRSCIINSIALSYDGKTLASGGDDALIKLWNMQTSKCLQTFQGHKRPIWSVAISSDGKTLASSSSDFTIRIWDIQTGNCSKVLKGHINSVYMVEFSQDNNMLISASSDRKVKLWNVQTGECIKTLSKNLTNNTAQFATILSDSTIVTGSNDNDIDIVNIRTGECVKSLVGHKDWVWTVAASSDGKILASGSFDKTIKLWDTSTGECLETLHGHTDRIKSVTISPNDKIVGSGSDDTTVKIWDISTGKCLQTLQGHEGLIKSVVFNQESTIVVSGSYDGTIKIWDISTGECLKTLSNKPYANMKITGVKGLSEAEKNTLKALGAMSFSG